MSRVGRALLVAVALLGPLVSSAHTSAAPASYTLVDLGVTAPGDPADQQCQFRYNGAEGINASGVVVGQRPASGDRYVPAATAADGDAFKKLSSPAKGGVALAVNDKGVIVGRTNEADGPGACGSYAPAVQPAEWIDGKRTDLPTGDAPYGQALAVNEDGVIAGIVYGADGSQTAASWIDGKLTLLPCPGAENQPGGSSSGGNALSIDAAGAIVGQCYGPDPNSGSYVAKAVVWKDGEATELDLGDGGTSGSAYAINDDGVIAGTIMTADTGGYEQAAVWTDGKPAMLPIPDGAITCFPEAINAGGDIAGTSYGQDGLTAVAWIDGELTPLSELASDAKGWSFSRATDIADDGTIVGWGALDGEVHGFILRPKA